MYYKDVSGVLLCFDLTDEESYKNVNFWLGDLNKHAPRKLVKVLVGNKADLCLNAQGINAGNEDSKSSFENKREINYDSAQQYALDNQMYYYEVSAKTGKNVNEVFQKLCNEISSIARQNIDMRVDADSKQISVLDEALGNRGRKLQGQNRVLKKEKKCC